MRISVFSASQYGSQVQVTNRHAVLERSGAQGHVDVFICLQRWLNFSDGHYPWVDTFNLVGKVLSTWKFFLDITLL